MVNLDLRKVHKRVDLLTGLGIHIFLKNGNLQVAPIPGSAYSAEFQSMSSYCSRVELFVQSSGSDVCCLQKRGNYFRVPFSQLTLS